MTADRTVLCVEDNPITRKMIRLTLETEGYAVVEASDGRAALEAVGRQMPDAILQDLILPDMDGFELVRRVRTLPAARDVPILALSGFLGSVEDGRCLEAGFTALLVKPVEPSRLIECLAVYLPPPRDSREQRGCGARVLLVDDDPVQLKLLRVQLTQLGFEVLATQSASDAIEQARKAAPDVVLADVLMPGVDGFELCLQIRRDPKLASVPVILASAWYQTSADTELAQRVGANALVFRTPDLHAVVDALLAALEGGAAALGTVPDIRLKLDHATLVVQQLEKQVAVNSGLARRCALQAAQIALLSGVATALTAERDMRVALREVLEATLDAAGISKGALFLLAQDDSLQLRHAVGFTPDEQTVLAGFFGHLPILEDLIGTQTCAVVPSSALPESVCDAILSGARVTSAQIVTLVCEGRSSGAMILAATGTDVTSPDSTAFARAMGNQLAQSLELATSFDRVATSERRYRTLTDNAHDAIAILTTDGSIREVNIRMEQLVGLTRQELAGRNIREFAAPVPDREMVSFNELVTQAPGRTQQVSLQTANGGLVLMEFSAAKLDVGDDHLIFAIGRDVTEQVKTQAQLMVADRMASIGMMAAGVAHEINNPLAAVTMNLHLAADDLESVLRDPECGAPRERLTEELRDAREAASRVRDIVQDLKLFSRQEEDRRGAVDLSRVLDSALRMARNEIRHRAQVVKDYAQVPLVLADESRLGQVFLNLLVNAAQAVPEGHADANEIRVRTRTVDADWVRIDISDTGHGMSPHVLSNLFTPFFTTKPTGIGTGLGLAICHRIITSLGGEIEVESRVGTGTTFSVTLPVASVEDEIAVTIPSTPPGPNRQRGRVLVVDDDSIVGVGVSRLLSPDHDVEVVTSAAKALDLIHAGLRFDVILCDLMMPVMDGVELHEALSASEPDQARRMIFLTAGAFTPRSRSFLDRIPNARLEKPFELQTLRALVNERTRSGLAVGD